MRGDDLADRLVEFAVQVIAIIDRLPKSPAGKHIGGQLLRSGTSPGANYEEARAAQSKADFVHKLSIVHKELQESRFWLKVIVRTKILSTQEVHKAADEVEELCRIVGKSLSTARSRE